MRYIDADKLIAHLKDEIDGCCEPHYGGRINGKSIAYGTVLGLKSAISFAETLSTTNVVPKSVYDATQHLLKGAHERIEQLDKLCGDLQKSQSEWISVEDRLPEEDGEVLVYNGKAVYTKMFMYPNEFTTFKKEPNFCYCDKSGDVWWIKSTDKITHWMLLPEAPKMKGE